jgi:dGTPase
LEYKTQVFVNGEGDHYRTRLTHTLEVAQISRTIARELCLNEDLAEAVALAHDLGHTPFGHAGERRLDTLLRAAKPETGGFNHNAQGLRVVDILEIRYSAFPGLNLTYETREAFIRHGGAACNGLSDFPPNQAPLLEVATTLVADDIAYLAHDLDDGLYSHTLEEDALGTLAIWRQVSQSDPGFASLSPSLKRLEAIRKIIDLLVGDVVESSRERLQERDFASPEAVREASGDTISFSPGTDAMVKELKSFLFKHFYQSPGIIAVMQEAEEQLESLFTAFLRQPTLMPGEYQDLARDWGKERAAADYVSGMTDRFAQEEFRRLKV